MLNNLQAPIEQEEETKEGHLEDEMLRNIEVVNDWSNKSFDMLLELLKATFPMCNSTILSSFYEAKQKLLDLDDVLKHPVDDEGWKHFDSELPHLASNPRNVRLGLASDGFNPFGHKSAPYTLLWTINDFPAYGDLLKYKWGIRSRLHDGKVGRRAPPVVMNEHEIIEQLDQLKFSVMSKHPLYVRNKVRPEESIAEAYVMNELSTFCSSYLSAIETRFTRDERNDDTILDDEVIGEVENFEQKVRPSGMSSLRTLSREEKRLFHWYIFNNVDEILEFRNNWKVVQVVQNKCIWDVPEVDDVENEQLNVLEIIAGHQVDEHIEDDNHGKIDISIVHHVIDDFIDDGDEQLSHRSGKSTISSFSSGFDKIDAIFLLFVEDLDNPAGGLSSMNNNLGTAQPFATLTPRRRGQS
ncbi:hypothetical protein E6C27_scaffold2359G00020 [Cucumis melo var. makuwa]|uniref:DUF4218 domain-containing protein n=1 Tax=Cucumis melo var. makuwa TaxID=1194695 RepID=A0A5A7UGU8_CUCMM|nr:hypothetical protein E6C27_scaffold2359G00020 [Cucumis melo var. makuwa]